MPKIYGVSTTIYGDKHRIRATLGLLRWYRDFTRSECDAARDPSDIFNRTMTREEARARLDMMINVAINRKGGAPYSYGRRDTSNHARALLQDRLDVEAIRRERRRVYQFRTREYRQACGHMLANRMDDHPTALRDELARPCEHCGFSGREHFHSKVTTWINT
jgi:hypothetical protein